MAETYSYTGCINFQCIELPERDCKISGCDLCIFHIAVANFSQAKLNRLTIDPNYRKLPGPDQDQIRFASRNFTCVSMGNNSEVLWIRKVQSGKLKWVYSKKQNLKSILDIIH